MSCLLLTYQISAWLRYFLHLQYGSFNITAVPDRLVQGPVASAPDNTQDALNGKNVALQKGCKALLPEIESRIKAQAQWLAEVCEHQGNLTLNSSVKLRTACTSCAGSPHSPHMAAGPHDLSYGMSASCSAF